MFILKQLRLCFSIEQFHTVFSLLKHHSLHLIAFQQFVTADWYAKTVLCGK